MKKITLLIIAVFIMGLFLFGCTRNTTVISKKKLKVTIIKNTSKMKIVKWNKIKNATEYKLFEINKHTLTKKLLKETQNTVITIKKFNGYNLRNMELQAVNINNIVIAKTNFKIIANALNFKINYILSSEIDIVWNNLKNETSVEITVQQLNDNKTIKLYTTSIYENNKILNGLKPNTNYNVTLTMFNMSKILAKKIIKFKTNSGFKTTVVNTTSTSTTLKIGLSIKSIRYNIETFLEKKNGVVIPFSKLYNVNSNIVILKKLNPNSKYFTTVVAILNGKPFENSVVVFNTIKSLMKVTTKTTQTMITFTWNAIPTAVNYKISLGLMNIKPIIVHNKLTVTFKHIFMFWNGRFKVPVTYFIEALNGHGKIIAGSGGTVIMNRTKIIFSAGIVSIINKNAAGNHIYIHWPVFGTKYNAFYNIYYTNEYTKKIYSILNYDPEGSPSIILPDTTYNVPYLITVNLINLNNNNITFKGSRVVTWNLLKMKILSLGTNKIIVKLITKLPQNLNGEGAVDVYIKNKRNNKYSNLGDHYSNIQKMITLSGLTSKTTYYISMFAYLKDTNINVVNLYSSKIFKLITQ